MVAPLFHLTLFLFGVLTSAAFAETPRSVELVDNVYRQIEAGPREMRQESIDAFLTKYRAMSQSEKKETLDLLIDASTGKGIYEERKSHLTGPTWKILSEMASDDLRPAIPRLRALLKADVSPQLVSMLLVSSGDSASAGALEKKALAKRDDDWGKYYLDACLKLSPEKERRRLMDRLIQVHRSTRSGESSPLKSALGMEWDYPPAVIRDWETALRKALSLTDESVGGSGEKDRILELRRLLPRKERIAGALALLAETKLPLVSNPKLLDYPRYYLVEAIAKFLLSQSPTVQELTPFRDALISRIDESNGVRFPRELVELTSPLIDDKLAMKLIGALDGTSTEITAKTAAKWLEANPALFPKVLPSALEALKKNTERPSDAIFPLVEAIRGTLPIAERTKLDLRLKEIYPLKTREGDPCAITCGLVDKVKDWGGPNRFSVQSGDARISAGDFQMDAGLRTLGLLFILKAAPYCKAAEILSGRWTDQLRKEGFSLGPTPPQLEKAAAHGKEEEKKLLESLKDLGIEPEALSKAHRFMASTRSPAPPTHYASLYAKIFFELSLNELEHSGRMTPKDLKAVSERNRSSLQSDLAQFEKAYSTDAGSLFNSFGLASAVLASPRSPVLALKRMTEIRSQAGDPRFVPYTPSEPPSEKRTTDARGGESLARQGSARAVPFQLALLTHARNADEYRDRKDDLFRVLRNFNHYSHALRLHSVREIENSAPPNYQHLTPDWLAPYFYFPALPYATAAVRKLFDDPRLSEAERVELRKIQSDLRSDLFSLLRDDKYFAEASEPITGRSSLTYLTPLAGLALLPLIEKCDGKPVPPSLGILRRGKIETTSARIRDGEPRTGQLRSVHFYSPALTPRSPSRRAKAQP